MNAERGWIASPQPKVEWRESHYSREAERIAARVEEWAAHHRGQGHNPRPAPTRENPERWDCECGYIWRILTVEQTRQKFAHLRKRRTPAHEVQTDAVAPNAWSPKPQT
jgi:hypothetical protein